MQDSYKYLGILQANGDQDKDAQRSTEAKYLQKIWQVLPVQQEE